MSVSTPAIPPLNPAPPQYRQDWAARLQAALNAVVGKVNNVGVLTLAANAASTTLTDSRLGGFSVITFMPQTAHAATAHGTIYVTAQAKGVATINHANTADTDKTFGVAIHG